MCPKKGINPTILLWGWDWEHQTYSRERYGSFGNKKMVVHGEILLLIDIGGSDCGLKTEDDDNFAQNLEELLHWNPHQITWNHRVLSQYFHHLTECKFPAWQTWTGSSLMSGSELMGMKTWRIHNDIDSSEKRNSRFILRKKIQVGCSSIKKGLLQLEIHLNQPFISRGCWLGFGEESRKIQV